VHKTNNDISMLNKITKSRNNKELFG